MSNIYKSSLRVENIPFKLPSNWTWYKWGDLISGYQQGLIRSNRELNDTGIPYLKMNNLDSDGGYSLNKLEQTDASKEEINRYKLHKGDFLLNVRNSKELVGKTCVIGNHDFDLIFNHMLVRIRHHDGVSGVFINALLKTPVMRKFIDRCKKGTTTVIALYQKDLYEIPIPLPDKNTHDLIVSFIENYTRKIELNNLINSELEAIAKNLYDYWFVQFDFPNAKGKPYKTNDGKMVWNDVLKKETPEGWCPGIACDLFDFNPTISIKKGLIASYIDMNAIPESGYMTGEIQKKEFNGGMKFQNGDVVVARITPCLENGKTALISLLDEKEVGFGSTEFIVLRGKDRSLSGFASYLTRSELFRKYAIANMTGTSGRKRVDSNILQKFPMTIPDFKLLERFETIVDDYFRKQTVNTKENQQLTELRDWLLPMLMNGQVKVGEIEDKVGLRMAAEPQVAYKKSKVK